MIRFLPFIFAFIVTVYSVCSCIFTSEDDFPVRIAKPIVVAVIILTTPLGGLVWLAWLFMKKFDNSSDNAKEKKIVAPDDNDEFLFTLDRDNQLRRDGILRDDISDLYDNFKDNNDNISQDFSADNLENNEFGSDCEKHDDKDDDSESK